MQLSTLISTIMRLWTGFALDPRAGAYTAGQTA